MQVFVQSPFGLKNLYVENIAINLTDFASLVGQETNLDISQFYLTTRGGTKCLGKGCQYLHDAVGRSGFTLEMKLRVLGGIDFQHREGSKIGSGGMLSESQAALERRERLRKLALETIDITKDPYFMRNHLGTFECKLCLTLHKNEGNYLAHTQGKRHQANLGRRAAMEEKVVPMKAVVTKDASKTIIKIGRPGYKVVKSRDLQTHQRSLTFEIDYPESEQDIQPRHRFMSAYEQKVEAPDKNYQYILFACDPYETIAFKIPNQPVDRKEGRFYSHWDPRSHKFVLQLFFLEGEEAEKANAAAMAAPRAEIRFHGASAH